jgi:serine/threonine protein kinase
MSDLIGKIFANRYCVESFLGKGGMAEVYKVWDEERSVPLAMKILYADMAEDRVFLRRFKREADTLSTLQHPNIVRFYGLEKSDGLVFLLMEYVEGSTLRKEIYDTDAPFSIERILEVMQPITAALNYAHKKGFIHCDVKPANIMLHKNGNILVADFGIARMSESSTVTMAGAGTPAYMSPEQVLGEFPSPQMDVYSLGVILYEMLTGGERPFTGEQARVTGTTAEKVRWEQRNLIPPSPREYNPSISPALEKVVLTCLQKDSSARYQTALDVYDILRKISVAASGGETDSPLDEMEKQALQFESIGNLTEALRAYREIKQIDPLFPNVDAKINQLEGTLHPKPIPIKPAPITPKPKPIAEFAKAAASAITKSSSRLLQILKSMPRKAWIISSGVSAFVLILIALLTSPATTVEGNNGFYFTSDRSGLMQIYHINKQGTRQQVTNDISNNSEAVRGDQGIYFTSDRKGKLEIFHLNDSGKTIQVTNFNGSADNWNPVPYGNGTYFVSNRSGKEEIYYVDKADVHQVTQTPGSYISIHPAPTMRGLYFSSNRTGRFEIFFMDNATRKVEQITNTTRKYDSVLAAPFNDGIYYVSDRDGENLEIYYMNSKGNVTQITHTAADVVNLNPLPTYSGLYFISNRSGTFEVYHLANNSSSPTQVTHSPENSLSAVGAVH